jgi:hypothetical protein
MCWAKIATAWFVLVISERAMSSFTGTLALEFGLLMDGRDRVVVGAERVPTAPNSFAAGT